MPIYPDEDQVRRILAPFEDRLIRVHQKAWERWEGSPHRATAQFARTMPTMVYEFIAHEAAAEFGEDETVRNFDHPGSVRYLFGDEVLVRFKKGGPKGVGQNIQTRAERAFTDPRLPFADKPDVSKVEVCWFPNRLKTKLDRVAVVARDLDVKVWSYNIGEEAAEMPLPLHLPIVPINPARRAPLVLVKDEVTKRDRQSDK